ncbi:hypothetical protein [Moorena producens]|nr:hypothetical protein [Moorena producens]
MPIAYLHRSIFNLVQDLRKTLPKPLKTFLTEYYHVRKLRSQQ